MLSKTDISKLSKINLAQLSKTDMKIDSRKVDINTMLAKNRKRKQLD